MISPGTMPDARTLPPARCTIVVPCYNEADRLQPGAFAAFLAENPAVHFLFVNDGSRDRTLDVLRAMERAHPDSIAVLDKQPNGGKAEAIREGMLAAIQPTPESQTPANPAGPTCEFVGFWDADLATPLDAIPHLLHKLQTNPVLQMVFGSRVRLLGRTIQRKGSRHYAGRLFATVASLTLSLPIYDTQCGAKIFRTSPDLAAVLAEPFASKWIFDVEIIARFIQRRGRAFCFASIYEFPLHIWRDIDGSKLRGTDFLRSAANLFTIYRKYGLGAREPQAATGTPRTAPER